MGRFAGDGGFIVRQSSSIRMQINNRSVNPYTKKLIRRLRGAHKKTKQKCARRLQTQRRKVSIVLKKTDGLISFYFLFDAYHGHSQSIKS